MAATKGSRKGGKGSVMPYMIVRHKVEDYERWKPVFDEHASVREQSGSQGGRLFRNADDPNETLILWTWDNLDNARAFAQSQDLRETMRRAGVIEPPDIFFLEEVEHVPV
jgi:heme-degrading monooxygenase HmoA